MRRIIVLNWCGTVLGFAVFHQANASSVDSRHLAYVALQRFGRKLRCGHSLGRCGLWVFVILCVSAVSKSGLTRRSVLL